MAIINTSIIIIIYVWPIILIGALFLGIRGRNSLNAVVRSGLVWSFRSWVLLALLIIWTVLKGSNPDSILPEPYNMVIFLTLGGLLSLLRFVLYRRDLELRLRLEKDQEALDMLRNLEAEEFEETVAHHFRKLGCRVKHVGQTADHGIDLEIRSPERTLWVVQCKRYRGAVGEPAIRDLFGTMQAAQAERGYLTTSGRFTANALRWAEGKEGLILIDGVELVKAFRDTNSLEWALRFET